METGDASKTVKITETGKTIYERRAVRRYKDKPVDRKLIEQVLDAGRMAPSAMNKQPWHMKHELPHMLKQGKGTIVNCASVARLIGFPGLPANMASKLPW